MRTQCKRAYAWFDWDMWKVFIQYKDIWEVSISA